MWPRIRLDSYGSPFRNEVSGVAEDDSENNRRFEAGMKLYLDDYRRKHGLKSRKA